MIKKQMVYPNLLERATFIINPEKGQERFNKRLRALQEKNAIAAAVMTNSGYGNHGASVSKNSLIGWTPGGGDSAKDIDQNVSKLRIRARDLDAGGGLARSATRTMKTNVVGMGITPKPKIDFETLGISEEAATEWQKKTKREFALWAESQYCDAARRSNFYQLQQLAFLSMMLSGDVIALLPSVKANEFPYRTRIQLIEADRLATPGSNGTSEVKILENGLGKIIDGVEINATGEVVAYHIRDKHPLEVSTGIAKSFRIPAYGNKTGLPNVLHVLTEERPGQMRGVPFVAPMIEQLKQLSRYSDAELAANIISSMFTLFLTQTNETGKFPLPDAIDEEEKVTEDPGKIELAPGAIYKLEPGTKPESINPMRNNSSYDDYVNALVTQIGASMEIPAEVLMKKFNSNYTASRGALLEFWRVVKVERANFTAKFCKPCYETWMCEAVALGRIEAPGFFDDIAIRKAWCGAEWIGSNMGIIDPLKEVNAADKRILLNISTQEREAAEFNGSDWEENMVQRRKETAESGTAQDPNQTKVPTVDDTIKNLIQTNVQMMMDQVRDELAEEQEAGGEKR